MTGFHMVSPTTIYFKSLQVTIFCIFIFFPPHAKGDVNRERTTELIEILADGTPFKKQERDRERESDVSERKCECQLVSV